MGERDTTLRFSVVVVVVVVVVLSRGARLDDSVSSLFVCIVFAVGCWVGGIRLFAL
jgi:hypothetical protein